MLRLNSDVSASWVTGYLPQGNSIFDGDILKVDPTGGGTIQFENGVTAHALLTPRGSEWEAICDSGTVTCWNNGWQWQYVTTRCTRLAWMYGSSGFLPRI